MVEILYFVDILEESGTLSDRLPGEAAILGAHSDELRVSRLEQSQQNGLS